MGRGGEREERERERKGEEEGRDGERGERWEREREGWGGTNRSRDCTLQNPLSTVAVSSTSCGRSHIIPTCSKKIVQSKITRSCVSIISPSTKHCNASRTKLVTSDMSMQHMQGKLKNYAKVMVSAFCILHHLVRLRKMCGRRGYKIQANIGQAMAGAAGPAPPAQTCKPSSSVLQCN